MFEFLELVIRVAAQSDHRQAVVERFKGAFCGAVGASHAWSSSAPWAESDLQTYMEAATENPPMFLEAFWTACESVRETDDLVVPDLELVNELCRRFDIKFRLAPPRIEHLDESGGLVPAPDRPASLSEKAASALQECLQRSEELLAERRPREAVQEMLWILESVSTAFRGAPTPAGAVRGKYFNQIVKELKAVRSGTTFERVIEWCLALHGYVSSPTGAGVRHGLDLEEGSPLSAAEGRLLCNLIRSYIGFFLSEHERLMKADV